MPPDPDRLADVVIRALLLAQGDEVDLVFRYGSRLRGDTHAYSDLDISYVPVHDETWDSITVLVDGMMCDLYAIHWSKLERMSEFDDPSGSILLEGQIVYQRSGAAAARFQTLAERLRTLQRPEARAEMVRKAQVRLEAAGYPYYLLRHEAEKGHLLATLQQARRIVDTVLHSLAIINQSVVDMRKRDRVLALPLLPADFAGTLVRLRGASKPEAVVAACETLIRTTRDLLITEARTCLHGESTFPVVLRAGYPEFKADLLHVMLACERGDASALDLVSIHHELMIHAAQALDGIERSDFDSLSEYEQDLAAEGFPDLLSPALAGDQQGLRRACLEFDEALRRYLTARDVALEEYATIDELEAHLARSRGGGQPT